jgi:hypothetical protein
MSAKCVIVQIRAKLMRPIVIFALSLLAVDLCRAAEFHPFDDPKPVAILIETNPWAMVIGADTPRVAIYEDGEVIFAKELNQRVHYYQLTLDNPSLNAMHAQLSTLLSIDGLKHSYELVQATDQPETKFYLRDKKREYALSVYGLSGAGNGSGLSGAPKNAGVPRELLDFYKWLLGLDSSQRREWSPTYVEVMLWDYSYAPQPSIKWPRDWPSLDSDRAVKRAKGYSIFLDGRLQPQLAAFLATRSEKGAVEIGGKKMAADYRYTFPGEPIWRKAFSDQ